MAAHEGDAAEVSRLLAEGAPIDARNEFRETPLHLAVDKGRREVVEILLAAGADLNPQTCGENPYTPLDYALETDIRALLIAAGGVRVHRDPRRFP